MTVTVRRLQEDDLASYREIRLEALRDHPGAFGDAYELAVERPESFYREGLANMAVFGAFDGGGRQVGLMTFILGYGPKQKHRGEIIQVYVRPEAPGTGTARGLIEAIVDHARPLVVQLHLGVSSDNAAAIRFYEKAGFHIYGTEPRTLYVNGRYIDEHLMVRFLDEGARKEV